MKLQSIAFTALTLLPLTACLDQDDVGHEPLDEDVTFGEKESAICWYQTNQPVTADDQWNLNNGTPKSVQFNSYGNTTCRRLTFGYLNAAEAKAKVHYTGPVYPVFNATNCDDVTITARFWYFDNGAWTSIGSRSDAGTWTGINCLLPEVSYVGTIIRDEIRMEITTAWGTATELPIRVTGDQ